MMDLDSQVITNMLLNRGTTNMKLKKIIIDAINLATIAEVTISHCLREANQVTDFFAKLASSSGIETFYASPQHLPREVKGLIQLDK